MKYLSQILTIAAAQSGDGVGSCDGISFSDSTTSCSATSMSLMIPTCAFSNARLTTPSSAYIAGPTKAAKLADPACVGSYDALNDEYIFAVSGDLDNCNSQRTVNATHVVYKNAAQMSAGRANSMISRERDMLVDFECAFELKLSLSILDAMNPTRTSYMVSMGQDTGSFSATMAVYTDDSFSTPVTADFSITVPEPIHIKFNLEETAAYNVRLDRCWATKTVDPSGEAYEFLSGGCGSTWEVDAGEMMVIDNGASTASAFWINSFEWNDDTDSVYFHCEAYICDPEHEVCEASCPSRRRRSSGTMLNTEMRLLASVGPIRYK